MRAENEGGGEGFRGTVTRVGAFANRFRRPQVFLHSALRSVTNMVIDREYPNTYQRIEQNFSHQRYVHIINL